MLLLEINSDYETEDDEQDVGRGEYWIRVEESGEVDVGGLKLLDGEVSVEESEVLDGEGSSDENEMMDGEHDLSFEHDYVKGGSFVTSDEESFEDVLPQLETRTALGDITERYVDVPKARGTLRFQRS